MGTSTGTKPLSPWERVQISRDVRRPRFSHYLTHLCETFEELCGDRTFGDDRAVIGGFAEIGTVRCVLVGQEKGNTTETRLKHNYGMVSPEGFRKGLRLMRLAEKFHLPVVSLVDTPGAWAGLEAEERGQGWTIAHNLREMASLETPIIVVVIGEGCSGGALGMAVGDVIAMLEHSYYAVISPEGCASILWKDARKKEEAAEKLKLLPEDLYKHGIIDTILPEPAGGAHNAPDLMYQRVRTFIVEEALRLQNISKERLIEERYQKFRRMGQWGEL